MAGARYNLINVDRYVNNRRDGAELSVHFTNKEIIHVLYPHGNEFHVQCSSHLKNILSYHFIVFYFSLLYYLHYKQYAV